MRLFLLDLVAFGYKQAQAALFGGLLLFFMLLTFFIELSFIYRYDLIFLYALLVQMLLLLFKLETRRELYVIFGFHVVATVMELFKTSGTIQSWHYPETALFAIGGVPLFAGFMYSAVGSYIARAWKLFRFRFRNYPNITHTYLLAAAIYINFFTHHFIIDMRYLLIAITISLYWRTTIYYTPVRKREKSMPLLLGFGLVAVFIWLAENISTFSGIWLYPNQTTEWALVSPQKAIAWFLLMIISFVLVSILYRRTIHT